ncbi:hypothetical protein [Bradyrhizobium uaiense]|uniref:Uncharacterized protein n=1 Tax=Bradyrhizobium uaiense TaxID=2594946 RepID=A0A6P1BLQ0_9BRAD|nr:hypothetical protein [Bradyrhizobium uaiense]NEU99129.1 hypothetical protein [Bradyrhizobium uaiense]
MVLLAEMDLPGAVEVAGFDMAVGSKSILTNGNFLMISMRIEGVICQDALNLKISKLTPRGLILDRPSFACDRKGDRAIAECHD